MDTIRGFSIIISFGEWAGFHYIGKKNKRLKRLCLGWMSICIMKVDADKVLTKGFESILGVSEQPNK